MIFKELKLNIMTAEQLIRILQQVDPLTPIEVIQRDWGAKSEVNKYINSVEYKQVFSMDNDSEQNEKTLKIYIYG